MSPRRMSKIKVKRAYEPPEKSDGARVLVDRLWPRGISKSSAGIDLWLKEIAPTGALRKWFSHDPAKWNQFRKRYAAELARRSAAVAQLQQWISQGTVTLVYGARDERYNNAVALKEYLEAL